jgi:hypothetical protein
MKNILKIKSIALVIFVFFSLNTHGQNPCAGKIVYIPTTPQSAVFGLRTGYNDYLLTINSYWILYNDQFIVGDTEYFVGDSVVITGTTSIIRNEKPNGYLSPEYLEFEIMAIEMLSSDRNIQYFLGTYEIHVDCTEQPWWIGDKVTLSIIEETDPEEAFDISLSFKGQFGNGWTFRVFVLNDDLFFMEKWGYFDSGYIAYCISREGYKNNDSIFINIKDYFIPNEPILLITDCHCKGKQIGSSSIVPPPESSKNKVYYDAANQVIVIDKTLQSQSLTIELYDMQGKVILKKDAGNTISVAHLPSGIYLYRLLENNRMIYSGKIVL